MNGILSGLILSGVSYLVATGMGAQAVYAGDEPQHNVETSVVVLSGDGADGEPVVVRSGGNGFQFVTATGDADGRSDGGSHVVRIRRQADPGAEDQGWLGVSISAHSDGQSNEVTVSAVVEDSPASEAGLMAGDVIISVDGESMTGNVTDAVNAIKSHSAGDEVTIVVLRDGEEITLDATLGSRASMGSATFEVKLDGEVEDRIVTRGRMLTRDGDGEWVMTELGDLSKLNNLPAHVQMFVPQSGTRVITMDGDNTSRNLRIDIEGDETLSISQEDGGDITVTRVDADGEEVVNIYADADELEANDPDAFAIFNKSCTHNVQLFGDGADFDLEDFDFELSADTFVFKMDGDDFDASALEWHENLEAGLGGATEAAEEALEHARVLIEGLEDGEEGMSAIAKLHKLRPLMGKGHGAHSFNFEFGKPKHSFEVRSDGTIEVKIRKGDTEVVQLFDDEDDLADRRPELFEKYRALMDLE